MPVPHERPKTRGGERPQGPDNSSTESRSNWSFQARILAGLVFRPGWVGARFTAVRENNEGSVFSEVGARIERGVVDEVGGEVAGEPGGVEGTLGAEAVEEAEIFPGGVEAGNGA